MKTVLLTFTLVFLAFCTFAQNQNNIWYFGQFAGLDFNGKSPKSLTNGRLNTNEGCASISDKNGSLLFYTDGKTIWNKNHEEMKNGGGLFGHDSSTQSAIITSYPDNDQLFFVFTVAVSEGNICYSIVNISGDGGLGEVTQKNNFLLGKTTEKLTATKHSNGKDIWVIGHKAQSSDFYAWLITKDGISDGPVISTIGTSESGQSTINIGSAKFSGNGSVLAVTANNTSGGFLELYKFDKSTGTISDPQKLTGFGSEIPYGIEFSPNGTLLYVSGYNDLDKGKIYQLQLPFTPGLITDKATVLGSLVEAGSLQLASDGKIYLSQRGGTFLHSINFPNKQGLDCSFTTNAVYLNGKTSTLGLPQYNVMSSNELLFSAADFCASDVTKFTMVTFTGNYDKVIWNFDDPSSGVTNISEDKNPFHKFSKPGDYNVRVTVFLNGISQTYTQKVTIFPAVTTKPTMIADNAALCDTGKVNITATGATASQKYNWYDETKILIEQNSGNFKTPHC
ncbi:MAG: hypothetical protein JWR05_1451 [Mucilaginibacter sp.]|nr:hypothetical protein [Mucilaginibacter sp.]